MEEKDWNAFTQAVDKLATLPIYMSDASHWTTLAMKADLSRLKELYGITWFIVDYLDLFADNPGRDNNERTAFISKQVHGMCKDLDLAGLVIQSMNKSGIGSVGMEKLSGSGKLMYDADQIIFMVQDDEGENIIRLVWDKMREGDGDRFMRLVRRPGYPAFGEYAAEVQ
jgi:replicative DNA helicase